MPKKPAKKSAKSQFFGFLRGKKLFYSLKNAENVHKNSNYTLGDHFEEFIPF